MSKNLVGTVDLLKEPAYDPNKLLNSLMLRLKLKNDAALARTLYVTPPVISKLRHRQSPVTAAVLLRMHDMTQVPVSELRTLMGVPSFLAP